MALSADIAKMYRQFALDKSSKDFHRILWRDNPTEPLRHLRVTRVTYGIASSAFHSTRCLVEIGNRCQDEDLRNTIYNSFYVDDFLADADTPEEAEKLLWRLHNELQQYGLELRKWSSSNSDEILSLPENLRETTEASQFMDKEYKIKTLGIK